jgi:hypothetical protein
MGMQKYRCLTTPMGCNRYQLALANPATRIETLGKRANDIQLRFRGVVAVYGGEGRGLKTSTEVKCLKMLTDLILNIKQ